MRDPFPASGVITKPSQAEAEAGVAIAQRWWSAERVAQAILAQKGALPRNYITGLILSNDADTDHDINVTAGEARNSDDTSNLVLPTEQTIQIDVSWAPGSAGGDSGGLSSSLVPSVADTWYHVFLILVAGVVEIGFDTSVVAANLITDHVATKFRRIGSVFTDGTTPGNIIGFSQVNDEFLWDNPPLDFTDDDPGGSAVTRTLTVPIGVVVTARFNFSLEDTTPALSVTVYFSPLFVDDEAAALTSAPLGQTLKNSSLGGAQALAEVITNTSGQVRSRLSGSDVDVDLAASTIGWIDPRGRDS